jgi:hypothetical protein
MYNWATLFLGGHKFRDLTLQVGGVSKLDSKIWLFVLRDSDPRMTALARLVAILKYRPVFSLERAPTSANSQLTVIKCGHGPRRMLDTKRE